MRGREERRGDFRREKRRRKRDRKVGEVKIKKKGEEIRGKKGIFIP